MSEAAGTTEAVLSDLTAEAEQKTAALRDMLARIRLRSPAGNNPASSMPISEEIRRRPLVQYNSLHEVPLDHQPHPHPPYNLRPFNIPQENPYPAIYLRSTDLPRHVEIRRVGRLNFEYESGRIKDLIATTRYNFVSIDTEFPGTIYSSKDRKHHYDPLVQYNMMRVNVDKLSLIQVGLTLSDANGNLATWGQPESIVVWEFAISDFDLINQPHNESSIRMLQNRGLDFWFHQSQGISSTQFAQILLDTGLVWDRNNNTAPEVVQSKEIGWITFHGAYDFGYLIKALTGVTPLPLNLEGFMELVRRYFGDMVYDVKVMLKLCYDYGDMEQSKNLMGGLEEVAAKLRVPRIMGIGNQSGSDSLLTSLVFGKLKKLYSEDGQIEQGSAGKIYPLTIIV